MLNMKYFNYATGLTMVNNNFFNLFKRKKSGWPRPATSKVHVRLLELSLYAGKYSWSVRERLAHVAIHTAIINARLVEQVQTFEC